MTTEKRRRFLDSMLLTSLRAYDIPGAYRRDFRPPEERLLQRLLASTPGDTLILDAGCGDGRLFPLLSAAARVAGLDAHRNALLRARQDRPEAHLVVGDLRALPFRSRSFRAIVLSEALEYVPPENRLPTLQSLRALLSPGGRLFVSGEHGPWWLLLRTFVAWRLLRRRPVVFGDYIFREREFGWQYHTLVSRRSLQRVLRQAGFRVEALEEDGLYVYALAARPEM